MIQTSYLTFESQQLLCFKPPEVWHSYFSQPIEVPALRAEIRTLFGQTDFPQMVLRMGYGQQEPPTPRRSVREVLSVI
jgi:hypothetical protein